MSQSFPGWFGIGNFFWPDSEASSGTDGDYAHLLVELHDQGPQELVGFCAKELKGFFRLCLGQAQRIVGFQNLIER